MNFNKISFDSKFFQKTRFDSRTISKYFKNSLKDLKIATEDKRPEVIFKFSYEAVIKTGIALIAFYGYRVKSRRGHHIKILEKLSQILRDEDIKTIGEAMRKKRNLDLYEGGVMISSKEAKDYLNFVKKVIEKTQRYLTSQKSLF